MPDSPAPSALTPRRILVRGVNWLGDAVMTTPALQRLRERFPDAHISLLTPEKLKDLWLHHPTINEIGSFRPEDSPWSIGSSLRFSQFRKRGDEFRAELGKGQEDFRTGRPAPEVRDPVQAAEAVTKGLAERLGHAFAAPFDLALILPNSPRSALEMWLARIPRRIGYARPWRNWFLTHAVPTRPGHVRMRKRSAVEVRRLIQPTGGQPATSNQQPASIPSPHHIHDYLHLVAALGANPEPLPPMMAITAAEVKQAEDKLLPVLEEKLKARAPGGPPIFLGLNPGAEYGPAKRWPAENFAAAAREVSRRIGNCIWLAFGASNDSKLCDDVARLAGGTVVNLAGKTSLRELMALLKLCRVLLTNDSGPMHVAAALDTPVVVPFGSTSPELTGPGLPGDGRHRSLKSAAPCAPCFRRTCPIDLRCMTGIRVDHVMDAVLRAARSA